MEWLNYHHLHYFWMVAREGGLAPAAAKLRLSPPTLSAQINALEAALGEELFAKKGRRLVLTERGQLAYRYAEDIFTLGRDLVGALRGGASGRPLRLVVGVAQGVPKLVARRVLEPLKKLDTKVFLSCREGKSDRLIADLAIHTVDMVLTDAPAVNPSNVKVFNHFLGESQLAVFGDPELVAAYRQGFPRSLEGAPFLLPSDASVTRRSLEAWFDELGVRPSVVAELDDSALLKSLGEAGLGLFAAPNVIAKEIKRQYRVEKLGMAPNVIERFYAITAERKLKHPALVALTENARDRLFHTNRAVRR
jgi:LysR family transcriptional regulator, transcriptional activator of nhaA